MSATLILGASSAMASVGLVIELNKSVLSTAFDLSIDSVFENASLLSGMVGEQTTAEGWAVLASNDHGGDDHGDDDGGADGPTGPTARYSGPARAPSGATFGTGGGDHGDDGSDGGDHGGEGGGG